MKLFLDTNILIDVVANRTPWVEFVDVAEVGTEIIDATISANWNDFEDCVQSMVARREKVDYIITRNEKDFRDSNVPAISPRAFLSFFRQ